MYVVIKHDKVEHLVEKLNDIREDAIEIIDCLENAHRIEHLDEEETYATRTTRHTGSHEREYEYPVRRIHSRRYW
jgi:hypothetical protein